MTVSMTEAAAKHVSQFLEKRGKGIGLRVGVKTSGCSGMAYKLEFADVLEPDDQVFDSHGIKVIVDPKSLVYIDGTQLDYTREGIQKASSSITRTKRPLRLRQVLQRLKKVAPVMADKLDMFQLLGVPRKFRVDQKALDEGYRRVELQVHPTASLRPLPR